jgi:hypothetical protein
MPPFQEPANRVSFEYKFSNLERPITAPPVKISRPFTNRVIRPAVAAPQALASMVSNNDGGNTL